MAKLDIQVYRQVDFGTAAYPLAAGGETFEEGEVVVVSAGSIAEAGDDPVIVTGISATSSQEKVAGPGITRGTRATGSMITIYKPTDGQLFITQNYAEDGAGTPVTPAQADVGNTAGFTLSGGSWFVDAGTARDHVEVVAVLDSDKQSVGDATIRTPGTGLWVVFGFIL